MFKTAGRTQSWYGPGNSEYQRELVTEGWRCKSRGLPVPAPPPGKASDGRVMLHKLRVRWKEKKIYSIFVLQ